MINNIAQDLPPDVASDLSDFNNNYTLSDKASFKKYLALFVGALFIATLALVSYQLINSPLIISFTDTGEELMPATKASFYFAVSSINSDVDKSIKDTNNKADIFKQLLLDNKIELKDIKISEMGIVFSSTGYQSTVVIDVQTTKLEDLSNLTSTIFSNGSSYMSQPVLTREDTSTYEQKALIKALDKVNKQASLFATKKIKFVKKIINITYESSGTSSVSYDSNNNLGVTKTVTATYKMW